jgi:hypothetical protein
MKAYNRGTIPIGGVCPIYAKRKKGKEEVALITGENTKNLT